MRPPRTVFFEFLSAASRSLGFSRDLERGGLEDAANDPAAKVLGFETAGRFTDQLMMSKDPLGIDQARQPGALSAEAVAPFARLFQTSQTDGPILGVIADQNMFGFGTEHFDSSPGQDEDASPANGDLGDIGPLMGCAFKKNENLRSWSVSRVQ